MPLGGGRGSGSGPGFHVAEPVNKPEAQLRFPSLPELYQVRLPGKQSREGGPAMGCSAGEGWGQASEGLPSLPSPAQLSHNLGSFKQQKCNVSQPRGLKVQNQGVSRAMLPLKPAGGNPSWSLLVAGVFLAIFGVLCLEIESFR